MESKKIKAKTISNEYIKAMSEQMKEEKSKPKKETAVDKLMHSYIEKLLKKEITLDTKFKSDNDVNEYIQMFINLNRFANRVECFTLLSQEITKVMTTIEEIHNKLPHTYDDSLNDELYNSALSRLYNQVYIITGMDQCLGHVDSNRILYHLESRFLEAESQLLSSFHPNYYMIHNVLTDIFTYYDDSSSWYYKNINPSRNLEHQIKGYRKYYHLDDDKNKEKE